MKLFIALTASTLLAVADCQYRRIKYREDNYYEQLYKRRMAEEQMQKFSQTAFQRRLGLAYASKFPILPPRLRFNARSKDKDNDDIDLSSTNLSPSAILWELPRKHFNRILDSGTTVAPPEKLMRPRPTRPPAYSLDGFVPKPSTSNLELTAVHPPVSLSGASTSNSASSTSTSVLTINGKKSSSSSKSSVWGDAFLFREGKKSRGKKEKERAKQELLTRRFKSGSASSRRRSSKKGIPGVDYPDYVQIPETNFSCENKKIAGMYADKEAGCQVWHICTGVSKVTKARHSFLCAAGTIFSEKKGVCDWWYNVQC
ncbi:uncharacterized protein LOC111267260 isoform X1 [Varroa jacobsoni]|uniref:uncharacterized protein LOC111267260 isoform X1 n=2 Tax=Varroa jacobsoni TaxID=62625 RepID=UPI000BF99EFE|nr:uncharacterized protein LOC111267260 isoform X1 [Varroa jacobsoni]